MLIEIWIPGTIVPKARPRHYRGKFLLPTNYRKWRSKAHIAITKQISDRPTISKAAIAIKVQGSMRGDLDNIAGAILDALVSAKVLKDDRLSCVPKLSIEHFGSGELGAIVFVEEIIGF